MIALPDILVLFRLLAAHLLADFFLQSEHWIDQRHRHGTRAPQLYYHIGIVGGLTYLFLGDWQHLGLPLFIMITHFIIDWWKSAQQESTTAFLVDQTAHLLIILLGWSIYANIETAVTEYVVHIFSQPSTWIIILSYFISVWPFGHFIAQITSRWQQDLTAGDAAQLSGLKKAGMWIGCIERVIILTFILLNQYSAIGFLIAAKSIFRFKSNIDSNQERKETEYILIGTLLSFALTIALGIGANFLLHTWN